MVDLSTGPHTHEMKKCKGTCGRQLPSDAFGLHKSSTDGRRHVCLECVADESEAARVHRVVEKDKQFRNDKEKLKKHGYRWVQKPDQPGPAPVFRWVLLVPQGREVSKEQALRDIEAAANPGPDDDHPYF